jgi:hypothetical protein
LSQKASIAGSTGPEKRGSDEVSEEHYQELQGKRKKKGINYHLWARGGCAYLWVCVLNVPKLEQGQKKNDVDLVISLVLSFCGS